MQSGQPTPVEAPEHLARRLLAANKYMTLATADERGRPWASPVFYTAADEAELYWVSDPQTRHSRNIAARPEIAIVIFDSLVAVGDAQALYLSAMAELVAGPELEPALAIYSEGSVARGASAFALADVTGDATLRLYRATIGESSVLDSIANRQGGDRRIAVEL